VIAMTQELETALRAWRDARHVYYTNYSVNSDTAALWRTLLDAEIALRRIVDAMDTSAAQPEHTP